MSDSPPPIGARMRFENPSKFLEFYEKQLALQVVGLRHEAAVPVGTRIVLTLHPPGPGVALVLRGVTEKVLPRPDGSVRLRVALEADVDAARWLDGYVKGLRAGLELGATDPAESVVVESAILEGPQARAAAPASSAEHRPEPSLAEELRDRATRMAGQTYYQLLGLATDATPEGLRAVYHGLTRRFHPDLYFEQDVALRRDAGRLYRRVNEAYATLRDPERRRLYDKGLAGPPHTWTLRLTEEAEQQAQRQRRIRRGGTPASQSYWTLARDVLERAREGERSIRPALRESARLLRLAIALEPENQHFRHALDHVTYRLSLPEDD